MKTQRPPPPDQTLRAENAELRARLEEAEEVLRAIRAGEVDALVVESDAGPRLFTLQGLDAEQSRLRGEMLAQVSDAVIAVDTEERVTFLNAAAERQYGVRAGKVLGRNLTEIFTPHWPSPEAEAGMRKALSERGAWRGELIHRRPDGSELHVETSASALHDSGSAGTGCVISIRDITERQQAAAALRLTSQRFDLAVKASQVVLFQQDLELRYIWLQNAAPGFEDSIAIGKRDANLMERAADSAVTEALKREVIRSGVSQRHEVLVHVQGVGRHFDLLMEPLRDAAGLISGVTCAAIDITERKRAEQALTERTELLNGVLEGTTDVIFAKDLDSRLLLANAAFAAAAGSTPEQLVGKTDSDWFPPDVAAAVRQQDETVIAHGSPMQFEETVPVAGEARSFLTLKAPLRDGSGRVVGVLGIGRDITERKQAEERLRASEARLRRVFESNVVGMIRWDLDRSLIVDANAEFLRMTGYVRDDITSGRLNFRDLTPPEWTARNEEGIRAIQAHGNASPYEKEFFKKDGSRLPIIIAGTRFEDSPSDGMSFLIDLTEMKHAGEAMARLAAIVESSHDALFSEDLDGIVLSWNRGAEQIFGYRADEIVGTSIMRLIPEARQVEEHEFQRKLAAGERGGTFETARLRKDGREFHASITISPLRDAAGKVIGTSRAVRDITEYKRAEEALRESEARLSGILRRSPAGIIQTDATGCMTLVNARWCEMSGRPEAELLGRSIIEITHPSFVVQTAEAFGRLAAGGPDFQFEKAYCRKDGSMLRAQSNIAAIRSPAGEFLGMITVVLDISERLNSEAELRRLAAELAEADRRKDVFLATLAHELRNPLAPIRNGLHVMKLSKNDGETVERVRDMMDRQVSQLARLVDDLLDVSRITQGKVELRKERIDLKTVIGAALETSRPAIEQAGHELTVVVPDERIFVDGDATRLGQVMSNLLNNSAKYTHRGGHIRLTVAREDATAVVSVKDSGIGIPPAMLGRVFEMFIQVDRTLEKTTGGLGIGLSLAKGLMEMHGGTIEARSDGEGMGSEFVVRLPVVMDVVAGPDRPNRQTREAVPSALRRILVVDDNVDAADSLGQLLEMSGHEIRTAHDGEAGIEVAAQFRPDVVLMDIGMPKLNGYEAARRIRQNPWGRAMVLVALTGWGQENDRKKSADAGFDHHLVKPVEMDDLKKLLAG